MDARTVAKAVGLLLTEIRTRLDQAASIARAACTCADGGNVDKAVEIVLDVEQLTYEAGNLLNAASTLNRVHQESRP